MKKYQRHILTSLLLLMLVVSVFVVQAFATGEGEVTCNKHTGGTATCLEPAKCETCNTPYGNLGAHVEETPATCKAPAKCSACGKDYGNLGGHSFGSDGMCIHKCGTSAGAISVSLSASKFTYNGAEHKPGVTVKAGTVTVTSGYSVAYSNNKNAGTATVTVTGTGDNQFTATATFTIEQATLTVGPAGYSITQNDAYPGLWLSYSGLVAGDKVTITPAPELSVYVASGASMEDPIKPMGKHTIYWNNMAAATINNPNYKLVKYETATLQVIPTRANFTISGVELYATVDGYAVNLHKVSDANLEKILDKPEKDGAIKLEFEPESNLNYINTVRIPTELVKSIAEAANDAKSDVKALEVILINGRSIKFDAKALNDIAEKAEGKFVAVVMVKSNDVKTAEVEPLKQAQKKDLGDRPAYLFAVVSGDEVLDDIAGSFEMKIPYVKRYNEKVENLEVYHIAEDGKRTSRETSYDEDEKKVVWNTDSLALYVIEHKASAK